MDSSYRNDVWYSGNGVNWIRATDSAGWSARVGHKSVVFNEKIWITGGYHMPYYFNDVWYSRGLGIGEESALGGLDAECLKPEIYPNPAKSVIRVRGPFSVKEATDIKIFDVSGKLIKEIATLPSVFASQSIGTRYALRNDRQLETKISLKGINPGIYFLKFESGAKITKKLIIMR